MKFKVSVSHAIYNASGNYTSTQIHQFIDSSETNSYVYTYVYVDVEIYIYIYIYIYLETGGRA